jgi:hypothetical protein
MVDMDLVLEPCVEFIVVQHLLLQLEAITCMRMSKKHYCSKLLLAKELVKDALVNTGAFLLSFSVLAISKEHNTNNFIAWDPSPGA